jgi:transcription initiation factor IIE alpha subunit
MDADKYNRTITLLCPTCGSDQFSQQEAFGEAVQIVTCATCGREMTKDDLLQENNENITAHVDEVKQEIFDDIRKQFAKMFKK